MLKLNIKTSGSAFCDPFTGEKDRYCEQEEILRILKRLTEELETSQKIGRTIDYMILHDINGNNVGEFRLK